MDAIQTFKTSSGQLHKWFSSDIQFHHLYPSSVQELAIKHWTPLRVTRKVVNFLAIDNGVRILDIGSGVGTFCLSAAYYKPKAFYYGIEQRKDLVAHAEAAKKILGLNNVSFNHGNFTQLDLRHYDHFYFYNSFYENLTGTGKIDNSILYSTELYSYYSRYLFRQLERMPVGTRLATFHSWGAEVPPEYHEVNADIDNLLKFWIKL